MTYDQFWKDDPWIARAYRKAWVERRKSENYRDWLQGAYYFNAISIALGNAFRKQGTKAEPYLEEPFQIFPLSKEEDEAKAAKEKAKIEAVYASLIRQQQQRKQKEAEAQTAKEKEVNAET